MAYSIYIQGEKYYYQADKIELVDVKWHHRSVIKLTKPKECYDNGPLLDCDECAIEGDVYIPKDKITQIIEWK
jgi:hypothetical protein